MEKKARRKSRSKSQGDLDDHHESMNSASGLTFGRKEYEDGIYEGYFYGGKRWGKGKMKGKNGFIFFEGTWENDKANGYGIRKYPYSGDRHEGNYKDGQRDGIGIFLWANGDKYSGHFKAGQMHGHGRLEWTNGDMYYGAFENGQINGEGYKIYADGRKSQGTFQNSIENGWIKQTWPEGDSYSGFMIDNQIDQFGCFDWFKGDRYEGEWKNESMHGLGSYVQVNTAGPKKEYTVLEGRFHEGELLGLGYCKQVHEDMEFCGEFSNVPGEMSWGHVEYGNGVMYDGETRDFLRHGMGQLYFSKTPLMFTEVEEFSPFALADLNSLGDLLDCIQFYGFRFLGTFDDDIPHGEGILSLPDGQEFVVKFVHGIVVR